MERIIGEIGEVGGKLLVFMSGLHGNEPEGVKALKRVFQTIEENNIPVHGKFIGVTGNIQALQQGMRFLKYDLNRYWTKNYINTLDDNNIGHLTAEDREAQELLLIFRKLEKHNFDERVLVDLHTTSAEDGNFIVLAEDYLDTCLAFSLDIPIIYGLESKLEGTLLAFMGRHGYDAIAVEGGLMGTRTAVEFHTAVIWKSLYQKGLIDKSEVPFFATLMENYSQNFPSKVEIKYWHQVHADDRFQMLSGFKNFQQVNEGDILARDRNGTIVAPMDGLLLMPLYQQQGEDGFFIGREIVAMAKVTEE